MKEYFVFALLLILFGAVKPFNVQTTVIDGTANSELMEPFKKIGENYYLIEPTIKRTWLGAVNFCRTQGAHLTSIENEEEWQALYSYLLSKGYNDNFWIGANDIDTTFKFFWINTGQPMLFTKWGPGEPNNDGGNEKCVHLWYKYKYLMNDIQCHKQFRCICKADSPKTVSTTVW